MSFACERVGKSGRNCSRKAIRSGWPCCLPRAVTRERRVTARRGRWAWARAKQARASG